MDILMSMWTILTKDFYYYYKYKLTFYMCHWQEGKRNRMMDRLLQDFSHE